MVKETKKWGSSGETTKKIRRKKCDKGGKTEEKKNNEGLNKQLNGRNVR